MIPHGARLNGMAYWQEREAKEREQRRRPRSAAHDYAAVGDEFVAVRATGSGNGNGGGDVEGLQRGGSGQWEDEREEVICNASLHDDSVCLRRSVPCRLERMLNSTSCCGSGGTVS